MPPDPEVDLFNNEDGTLLPGSKVAITEDCLVDDRGFIYVDTVFFFFFLCFFYCYFCRVFIIKINP